MADDHATLARIGAGEGAGRRKVVALMINDGLSPVAAWRRLSGLSQSDLARRAGLSQVWVNRSAGEGTWHARDAAQAGGAAECAGVGVGGWGLSIVSPEFRSVPGIPVESCLVVD